MIIVALLLAEQVVKLNLVELLEPCSCLLLLALQLLELLLVLVNRSKPGVLVTSHEPLKLVEVRLVQRDNVVVLLVQQLEQPFNAAMNLACPWRNRRRR